MGTGSGRLRTVPVPISRFPLRRKTGTGTSKTRSQSPFSGSAPLPGGFPLLFENGSLQISCASRDIGLACHSGKFTVDSRRRALGSGHACSNAPQKRLANETHVLGSPFPLGTGWWSYPARIPPLATFGQGRTFETRRSLVEVGGWYESQSHRGALQSFRTPLDERLRVRD